MKTEEGIMMQTPSLLKANDSVECLNKTCNPHLQKAVIYIENNYHNAITFKDIMSAVALSHSALVRLFKQELGMTPIKYVWHYRIAVAEKLLGHTDLPIWEIASECGFKTVQHFCRKFAESHGCNPTAFRNAVASKKNSQTP